MTPSPVTSALCIVAVVTVVACAHASTAKPISLDAVQGAWWSSCEAPAAEFVIEGTAYYGDFLGRYELELKKDVLVFMDGLIDGHSVNVTHKALAFQVRSVSDNKLVLRPLPGNPYVADWELLSCAPTPPNESLHPDALSRAGERRR